MANSRSKVNSDSKYAPAKINLEGEGSVAPSNSAIKKSAKDNLIAEKKKEIEPKSAPKKLNEPITPCLSQGKKEKIVPKPVKKGTKPPIKCNLASLSIDKEGRNFILMTNAIPFACTSGSLQVVSGYGRRKKKVTCSISGLSGPCSSKHLGKVIDHTEAFVSKSDSQLIFEVSSKYKFFFFPWEPPTNSYRLSANTCDSIVGSEIIVYPDTYWKLQVITQLKGKKIDDITIKGTFREDDNNLTFSASTKKSTAEFTYSNDGLSLGAGISNSEDKKGGQFNYQDSETEIAASGYNDEVGAHYKDTKRLFDANISEESSKVAYKDDKTSLVTYANETEYGTHYKDGTTEYNNSYSAQQLVKDVATDSLTLTPNERDRQLKGQIQTKLLTYLEILQKTIGIVNFIETIVTTLTETLDSPIEFDVDWPNIDLSGEWYWKEIAGSPKCGFEVVVNGNFTPLIGCHCNIDLVGTALNAIPVVGKAIGILVKLYKKLTHNDFKINISISNALSFSFTITKSAPNEKFEASAPPALSKFEVILTAEVKSQEGNLILGCAGSRHGRGAEGSVAINIYLYKPVTTDSAIILPAEFEFAGITFVSYIFVKPTAEVKDGKPEDDDNAEKEVVRSNTDDNMPKNWLAQDKQPFSIPLVQF